MIQEHSSISFSVKSFMLALKGRQILTLSKFISDLRIPNNLEMNLINSEFASPSTGAAAIWIPIPSLEISAEVKYKKNKIDFLLICGRNSSFRFPTQI